MDLLVLSSDITHDPGKSLFKFHNLLMLFLIAYKWLNMLFA